MQLRNLFLEFVKESRGTGFPILWLEALRGLLGGLRAGDEGAGACLVSASRCMSALMHSTHAGEA